MLHALAAAAALVVAQAPTVHNLKNDWLVDGALTGGGVALYAASEYVLKPSLAPAACRWCDRAADGTDALNPLDAGARSALMWSLPRQGTAGSLSDLDVYVLMPVGMYGLDAYLAGADGALGGWGTDALIITEAVVAAGLTNQVVKFIAGRERPFVHVLPDAEKPLTAHPDDNNLSFFSGHTTIAFSLLFSTLSVAELRGYQQRWLLWAVGVPLALAAPYLRMAGDKHYLTDVLVGAVVGGTIGYFVPRLLHPRNDPLPPGQQPPQALSVSVGPSVITVAVAFP
ncbi:MAG TPA: phosphatase PAP2 family protein [Myxococcales bacterium]|nr:phosphatase PAP2 family protein [Myxococcales bacterium]